MRHSSVWGGAVLALLAISCIHQLGTGLVVALVPMRLAIEGFAAWVAGAMSTAFSVGFLLGCLAAPKIVARVPARTAIAVCALANAACAAALWLYPDPIAWCAARFTGGAFIACMWVVIEAWFGQRSNAANRGAVFGAYMLTSRVAFVIAQAALAWTDPRIGALFLIAAGFYAVSWLPVLAARDAPPRIHPKAAPGSLAIVHLAPAAAAGSLIHGLITTAQPALFPIYGVGLGLGMDRIALGLAAIQFGGMVLQLPLAFASDRWGRRKIMAVAAFATAALSFAAFYAPVSSSPLLLVALSAWGGAPAVIYSLAIAHANDRVDDHQRIAASSGLLMLWGLGAALGPMAASVLMDSLGHAALFAFTGGLAVVLGAFLIWRRIVRKPVTARKPLEGAIAPPG